MEVSTRTNSALFIGCFLLYLTQLIEWLVSWKCNDRSYMFNVAISGQIGQFTIQFCPFPDNSLFHKTSLIETNNLSAHQARQIDV